jgi:hypothetical protein
MKLTPILPTLLIALSAHAAEQRVPVPAAPAKSAAPPSADLPAVQSPGPVMPLLQPRVMAPTVPVPGQAGAQTPLPPAMPTPLKCDVSTTLKGAQKKVTYSVTHTIGGRTSIPAGSTIAWSDDKSSGQIKLGQALLPGQSYPVHSFDTHPGFNSLNLASCKATLLP